MSRLARTLLVTLSAAVVVLGVAGPAAAHVEVESTSSAPESAARLTFVVPTESDTASTTGITIQFPVQTPISSARTQAVPGWTAQVVTTALSTPIKDDDGNEIASAVTKVVWTATDGGIKPGQFGTFTVAVFPLPKAGTLFLPTVQHYSDGKDSNWVQQAQGGAEPEYPAPSVVISTEPAASPAAPRAAAGDSASGWGVGLGIAGIVLALVAGGVGGAALARVRRGATPSSTEPAAALTRTDA
jgi:uncharacterized protein YcnI